MKRSFILVVACLVVVLTVAAGAAPAKQGDECTWGASSIHAKVVDGKIVASEPSTSGCIPPR